MNGTKHKYTRRVQFNEPQVNGKYYKEILEYYTDEQYSYLLDKSISKRPTKSIGIY